MLYAVATYAKRLLSEPGKVTEVLNVFPYVIEAASAPEAEGIALRYIRRAFPGDQGWTSHFAAARPADHTLKPESEWRFEP